MNIPTRFSLPGSVDPVADLTTILVPVDCSRRSRALLRSASSLARCVSGHLVILYVYEPLTYAPAHSTAQQLKHCQEIRQRKAEECLSLFQDEFLDDSEVQSATLLTAGGFPEDEICKTARQIGADLIVASTHGYRGLNHLFLGSKAERLIRSAPCPILILPAAREGEQEQDVIELHYRTSAHETNRHAP